MAVTVVQSTTTSTAAASPTSITPTLSSGSKVGNLLVLVVSVTGTTPSITTPASWTAITNISNNGVAYGLFYRLNNPGGITAVAVTVGGTGGGASAILVEFATSGQFKANDVGSSYDGTFGTFQFGFSGVPSSVGMLWINTFCYTAQSISLAFSGYPFTTITGNASTSGTPNAQCNLNWFTNSGVQAPPWPVATLTGQSSDMVVRFPGDGAAIDGSPGGGQYAGPFYQGMSGG